MLKSSGWREREREREGEREVERKREREIFGEIKREERNGPRRLPLSALHFPIPVSI